jgi:subtilisin family serine protease
MKKTLQFIVWIMVPFSAVSQSAAWKAKVDPVVLKKAETNATFEFVAVLKQQADVRAADNLNTKEEKGMFVYNSLKAAAEHSQGDVITLLTKSNVTFHPFWVVNCVVITADAKVLEDVANLASVDMIIENAKYVSAKPIKVESKPTDVNAAEWGITKSKADQVWALGVKGAGAVVAGEDTGYEWTHPALKKQYRGWDGATADHNYNWHDAAHSGGGKCGANSKQPCDDQEHGTHTMGTMVGEDGANQVGMAPAAKWMGCRNMNVGVGTLESYIECFQFFLAPTDLSDKNANPAKSPHVINNSWGCPTDEGCNSSNFATMETVVNNLRAAGVVVVASAGNDGSKGCSSINTPAAILPGSFTVGSTTSSDGICTRWWIFIHEWNQYGWSARCRFGCIGDFGKP